MGLEFIQRRFDLPTLVIERGQLRGGRLLGVENRRQQAIERLAMLCPQIVFDDPHRDAASALAPIWFGGIEAAQVGAVGQAPLDRQT